MKRKSEVEGGGLVRICCGLSDLSTGPDTSTGCI